MHHIPRSAAPCAVAIIGGGFSGAMVATHLLRTATAPLTIALIERRLDMGCGIAYSTTTRSHLLNVPAGKMSAFPDAPDNFVNWLRASQNFESQNFESQNFESQNSESQTAALFAPRMQYGDYLQQTLTEAITNAPEQVHFKRVTAEAIALEPVETGAIVQLDTGESLYADRVVLATGNVPAALPKPLRSLAPAGLMKSAWERDAAALHPEESVLLVGTGLTMIDMAIVLDQQGHRGPIYAVSRHGLLPQRHRAGVAAVALDLTEVPRTARALLHQIRAELQTTQDWRAVIDALRPVTQSLWQELPLKEQQRFLRHLKTYWDVHRHRLAPEVADQVEQLLAAGRLVCWAGRIQSCHAIEQLPGQVTGQAGRLRVTLRRRGIDQTIHLTVDKIINCTGSCDNYYTIQQPLYVDLRQRGLIRPSEIGMGLDVAPTGAALTAEGQASSWFYALGSIRKGLLWETTAVPELRVQAQDLAQTLLQSLASQVGRFGEQPFEVQDQSGFLFRQLFDKESSTYTYLIADPDLRAAVLVDPVLHQVERDLQVLRELDLTLCYCLETHVHADHITGANRLRVLTGCQIGVPRNPEVTGADHYLQDQETLRLGSLTLQALATPGHTDSHLAYLVNDSHLLTGDALFIRGCGRTDFQGGDAGQLYDVVTQRLFALPDATLVYPGHDYQGRTVSTIGEEKRWNPRFANRSRDQFISLMNTLNLPYPQKIREAVPANRCCGAVEQVKPAVNVSANSSIDPSVYFGMHI